MNNNHFNQSSSFPSNAGSSDQSVQESSNAGFFTPAGGNQNLAQGLSPRHGDFSHMNSSASSRGENMSVGGDGLATLGVPRPNNFMDGVDWEQQATNQQGSGFGMRGDYSANSRGAHSARLDRPFETLLQPNQSVVRLKTTTWTRESHGLFDYESTSIKEKEFNMTENFNVYRKEMEIGVNQSHSDEETLARVVSYHGKFWIDRPLPTEQMRQKYSKLWRVVKDVNGGLKLKEGDSIKLGRFKLRVRQLVADDDGNSQGASMAVSSTFSPKVCVSTEQPEQSVACRICLMDSSDSGEGEDPLIRPCECKGSIEYIHLDCLRHWINGRLQINLDGNGESPKGSYFFRPLNCELCKTPYASHLKHAHADGTETEETIVDLPKTKAPYVVLERESHRPEEKGVHVISLADKNRLKLGRGHISDIRFNDVSISRWHATINYNPENKEFRLEDHDSKFGTLLATKPPIALDEPLHFQAGRTVLQFFPPKAQDAVVSSDFNVTRLESRGFSAGIPTVPTDDFDRFTSGDKME